MSDQSPILALPYIQAAQAQKHVTHNEALRVLDVLVQATVLTDTLTTPPVEGQTGDRYLVPAGGLGDWAGRDGQIAVREVSAWTFVQPQKGWTLRVLDNLASVVFDGTEWTTADTGGGTGPTDMLGINTGADATNRLAVSAPATLLTHEGDSHQLKINKASAGDTNSLLYQTNWSGRAEMGCAGNDDFAVKVSADGTAWNTAIRCNAATGKVTFPSGAQLAAPVTIAGRWYCEPDNRWVTHSEVYGFMSPNFNRSAGLNAEPNVDWRYLGPHLAKGSIIRGFSGLFRSVEDNITSFDFRLAFQHGPADNGLWINNSTTTYLEIFGTDGIAMNGWTNLAANDLAFEAPEDGTVLAFFRPIGTIASRTFVATTMKTIVEAP